VARFLVERKGEGSMRKVTAAAVVLPAVLVLASGCASKDWVRTLVSEKETRAEQRFTRVESRVGTEAQRIDGAETRITGVEGKVNDTVQRVEGIGTRVVGVETNLSQTAETASAARGRADEAMARAEGVEARLTRLWSNRHARNTVETVNVQFAFGQAALDDRAQTSLVALVREMQQNPRLTVDLEGYTDSKGPRDYNLRLAEQRVEAVRRFLVQKGVELPRINAIGLGPLADRNVPEQQKRRVSVKLMLHAD
jgi:outer membrane protein OmpA-like peptidoglycan-associated protein